MREDFGELLKTDLKQELETLSEDIETVREDVARIIWKSTVGEAQKKIACRPFTSLAWAFGSGFVLCGLWRLFRSHKKDG